MNFAGDRVAQKKRVPVLGWKLRGVVDGRAADTGGSVVVINHFRDKAEGVFLGLRPRGSEVGSAAQEHVHRHGMAVRIVDVTEGIEGNAERIDLPPGELLEARAIGAKTVGVP